MLEQEGLFFLLPVYRLLFQDNCPVKPGFVTNTSLDDYLELPRSSVRVCYKAYHNTYKGVQVGPNDLSLEDAVNQELTPGKI